jgi:hypothetical protein
MKIAHHWKLSKNARLVARERRVMLLDDSKKYIKFLTSLVERFKFEELTNETIDAYLDLRDQQPFDSDWSAMEDNLEKLKDQQNDKLLDKLESLNEKIREKIFMKIIKSSGSSELAAYLSDDIGMILDALILIDSGDSWAFGLLDSYMKQELPKGLIPITSRPDV